MNQFIPFLESLRTPSNTKLVDLIQDGYNLCFEAFEPTIDPQVKKLSARFVGRGVTWYGSPQQMIVIHKDYVDGMWGNIYDHEKMDELTEMIRNHDENVEIECSYAQGSIVNFQQIKEEQESFADGRFETDYDGKRKPASIGDDQLDSYIGSKYLEEVGKYGTDLSMFVPFKFKLALAEGNDEGLAEKFKSMLQEKLGDDVTENEINDFIEIELELRNAIANDGGDLNTFRAELRDGHHRVFGAINAGEIYVCMNLDKDDIPLIEGYSYVHRVTGKD